MENKNMENKKQVSCYEICAMAAWCDKSYCEKLALAQSKED